ncbi:SH3 domain-containing protein [Massilia sp. LXY-6]|uniref:SH3 domain-containing protein n=1 Tax=Massilia sp. LXY-6 TaxID=3379823 RepID=UPI003EE1C224
MMSTANPWALAAAYGLGLVLTLVLAAVLTPRRWWRRPTAGTLVLVGGGTLAFGTLFAGLLATPARPVAAPVPPATPVPLAALASSVTPAPRYRVVDDLNLRAAKATGAPRLAVLPAGTLVTRTGAADGDWWRVRARLKGQDVEGWASSLWLRRVDERAVDR